MIQRIKNALARCGISLWRINEREDETAELFFVKKQLDTRRIKDVRKYEVTVFRDVEAKDGGRPSRGFTSVMLVASMDDERLDEALKGAYYAAQFAANPYFDPPDPVQAPMVEETGELAQAMRKGLRPGPDGDIINTIDEELGDVIYYALAIANCYGIDMESVIEKKAAFNYARYPEPVPFELDR